MQKLLKPFGESAIGSSPTYKDILYVVFAATAVGIIFSLNRDSALFWLGIATISPLVWLGARSAFSKNRTSVHLTLLRKLKDAQTDLEKYHQDISKEHAQMLILMESISESILAIDDQDNVLFANTRFKKYFLPRGTRKQDVSKRKLWEVNRNVDVQGLFHSVLATGSSARKKNVILPVNKATNERYFDIKVGPMEDGQGKIFGAVGVFHDVTERKLAEQKREDFAANVSHELRTPLTAMKGYLQIIKNSSKEPLLKKVENNADRLARLVDGLLDLTTIESTEKIDREQISTKEITEAVVDNLRQIYQDKRIHTECHYQAQYVWANAHLLEQALSNLLDNAFKYTPAQGTITVDWSDSPKGNQQILCIRDTGVGIPKAHLPRIFERLYRVDSSRSQEIQGSGLGLAIVKHIVGRHKGKIRTTSSKEGTTFQIKFPKK